MPMENTSSNSWDVQGLVDNTEQAQQPSSGFDGLAQDIAAEEFTKTQAAARWARRQDPSAYAEAQRLSPGIPPEIAVRQMELLRDNSAMNLYQTVFDRSPQLRNYYANQPKKLAFANPDELDQISGLSWLGAATSDAFNLGVLEYMAAQARIRKAQGNPLVGDDALLQRYADEQSRTFGAHGWFQQGATGVARMVPQIMGTAMGAQTGAVVGGAVGAGVGSVVPAIGTGIGGAAGMSAGAIAGAYQFNYDFQRGLLMLDFEKIKDENGQPIDPKVAEFAASVVGAGSAALDVVGMERLARVVPGAKAALGMITKDGMKNALRNPGIRQALTTFARNTLGVSGTEITTEVLQQGLQITGEASLRSQYSAENDQMDWSNAGQQLLDTAVQTAQVMSILGPFAAMTGLGADIRDINNSRQVIKNFNRINDTLADNEFVKRAPAEAANVIDAQLDNRKVALPAQEVVELFQSANADVYGPAIPNWRERLNVALASGGDVEVTIGEYVSYLNTSPVAEPLRTLVRAEPGGYTSGNISEFMNSLDAMIKSDSERAAQMGTPVQQMNGGTSIYASQVEAMRKPLRQMFAQKTADFYVDIIGSYYNAMAERVGQTPDEFYAAHPLSIDFGLPQETVDPNVLFQSAWHGSPHVFDQFSTDAIGSGEGAQVYGWGLYFAQKRSVAEWYKEKLSQPQLAVQFANGKKLLLGNDSSMHATFQAFANGDRQAQLASLRQAINYRKPGLEHAKKRLAEGNVQGADLEDLRRYIATTEKFINEMENAAAQISLNGAATPITDKGGRLFNVDVPDEGNLLEWDKPLDQQPQAVKDALRAAGVIGKDRAELLDNMITIAEVLRSYSSGIQPGFEDAENLFPYTKSTNDPRKAAYFVDHLIPPEDESSPYWSYLDEFNQVYDQISLKNPNGEQLYKNLSAVLGGEEAASKFLDEHGVPGLKYLDGTSRRAQYGTHNYVIFNDKHVKVKEYFQANRGSFQLVDGQGLIKLFAQADVSTLLHEFSHFFLENLKALSQASPEIAADYEIVKKALGIEGDTITREQHEKFAKMGEAYFYKGKAPSRALERAFAAFKGLLKRLYRNLKNLGGNISPEISEVFDRMLATEEQLDQMAQDNAYAPLFKSAAEMGVSEEDFLKFNGVVDNLRQDARATATEKLLGTIEQRNKGWARKEFNAFKAQARERLKSLPPYSHRTLMSEGRITIDVEKLRAKYSEAALKKFPASGLRKNGLDPQVAAELLGYPTADDMVHDFVTAPTLEEAATAAAKEEIKRRYEGNQNESELINAQVQQAMAQDGRVYALGLELQALSKKADKEAPASIAAQAATKLARDIVWSKPVKDINEKLLRANLRRAGSMKFAAAARGDWQAAANWARKQMLAQAMANEAAKVMRTVDRVRTKARKYTKLKSTSVDPAYVEQILAIVGQYEFAKVSNKALTARANLRSFIEKQVADGAVFVGLPERLLRDATTVNYKELSVEDLIAIGDTIDNLEHLGRLKSKLKAKDAAETFSSVKEQLIKSAYQTPVKKRAMKTYTQEEKQRLAKLAEWHASLLKPEQIVKWLDMDNIAGPFMENIFQPIADAQSKQNELSLKYNYKLMKIFDGLDAEYMDEILRVDELNTKMTRQELYAIALNTGTESNRQKLLRGELWNEGQLEAALTKLSEADWKRIQQVWDLLDGLWPEIATMYKRLTGVEPPKVEARGFVNIHGEWRGGYYPVVYDFNARRGMNLLEDTTPESSVGPDKLFENDSFKYVGTNNKYTVKRTEVAKPIKLNLSVLPGHIHTVIHDLAYREPVRAAYKLLWDPDVKRAISETQGAPVYDQLQHWLQSVASERSIDADPNSGWLSRIRRGTTMYGMGYRLTTALAQPLGFFNSMTQVKSIYLAKGIYEMSKNPFKTSALVQETSAEMRDRFNQMDRDIRENVRKLGQGKTKLDWIRSHAFWLIGMMDKYVANATWIGAYNQAIAKKGLSHELAVRDADSIVRMTQGTGHVKDMPKMMTSSETSKFFTMFYSFFAAQYNMQVDLTRKTSADIRSGEWGRILAERLPQWMYLIVCPAVFGALLSGQTPEEDENWLWWGAKKALFYPLNAVPIVRDISSAAQSGRDYQLTPMGRVFDSGVKAFARLNHWDGGDNWDPNVTNALRPIVEVASITMGLPTGQAVTSLDGLWKGLENDDLKTKDLFVGRQGR